jgi:hypothetical protein
MPTPSKTSRKLNSQNLGGNNLGSRVSNAHPEYGRRRLKSMNSEGKI